MKKIWFAAMLAVFSMVVVGCEGIPNDPTAALPAAITPGAPCSNPGGLSVCTTTCPNGQYQVQVCDRNSNTASDCFCQSTPNPGTLDGGVNTQPSYEFCILVSPVQGEPTQIGIRYGASGASPTTTDKCMVLGSPATCDVPALYAACNSAGIPGTPCVQSGFNACNAATGTIVCTTSTDWDDLSPALLLPLPPQQEVCTLAGQPRVDDDCDGEPDATMVDGVAVPTRCSHETCYVSADSDSYGDGAVVDVWNTTVGGIANCSQLTPPAQGIYVNEPGDCNDTDATINPAARETCDGRDNNCRDGIDEMNVCQNFLACNEDKDGDGQGDAADAPTIQMNVASCQPINGVASVPNALDCNDADATINGNVDEICDANGVDENCNGLVNSAEGLACTGGALTCGSQHGQPCSTGLLGVCAAGTYNCSGTNVLTCVQTTASSVDTCNGLDDNCDGDVDNGPVICVTPDSGVMSDAGVQMDAGVTTDSGVNPDGGLRADVVVVLKDVTNLGTCGQNPYVVDEDNVSQVATCTVNNLTVTCPNVVVGSLGDVRFPCTDRHALYNGLGCPLQSNVQSITSGGRSITSGVDTNPAPNVFNLSTGTYDGLYCRFQF